MSEADASAHGRTASAPLTRRVAGRRSAVLGFGSGAAVGVLGGMIGLGGAEFRLPLLIGLFGFVALQAVILNKALSLVVVTAALPARLLAVPFSQVADHWTFGSTCSRGVCSEHGWGRAGRRA